MTDLTAQDIEEGERLLAAWNAGGMDVDEIDVTDWVDRYGARLLAAAREALTLRADNRRLDDAGMALTRELHDLRSANERLTRELEGLDTVCGGFQRRAERAEAALSEVRQDAERYRWLRDNAPESSQVPAIRTYYAGTLCVYRGTAADAAIDAAMKGTT